MLLSGCDSSETITHNLSENCLRVSLHSFTHSLIQSLGASQRREHKGRTRP